MQIHSAIFEKSAPDFQSCPPASAPEFAFVGRSNVGKSSIINMLTRQKKDLAVVSSKPGRTRLINFFKINKESWKLVDLPGYGFAKSSKKHQDKFQQIVTDYLLERESLRCVFQLIDSNLTPQKIDQEFSQWLMEAGVPFVLVFTKADKSKPGRVQANVDLYFEAMSSWCDGLPRAYICSAKNGDGRKDILSFIEAAIS